MQKAKIFIQERIGRTTVGAAPSLADEIMKLKNLKDNGAITDEEFNVMKINLLKKSA